MARITECDKHKEFDCGGAGMCIPLSKVCDKRKDCPDGEDEPAGKCSRNECAKNNGECQHKCIDSFLGFRCECENGYVGQRYYQYIVYTKQAICLNSSWQNVSLSFIFSSSTFQLQTCE